MPGPWISLTVAAVILLLLLVVYAVRRQRQAAAEAAYVDDLERLAQARVEDFETLARLSAEMSGVLDLESLKKTIATELPRLAGAEEVWGIARINGWVLLAGEPTEAGGVMPRNLTAKPEAWECFPLNVSGRTVGLIGTRRPPDGFNEDQRRLLTTFCTLVAATVKNIHVFSRIRELSMIDPLTRCLMRQFGVEALSREMRRMRRSQSSLCVAVLDLDRFKELNDAHGHPVGDRALSMVGRVLREGLRASDIACRYGGDEFLIVLPETSLAGAVRALENVRRRISVTPIDATEGQDPLRLSASVGITDVELLEEDPTLPITRADATMYEAKRSGRNRVAARSVSASNGTLISPTDSSLEPL